MTHPYLEAGEASRVGVPRVFAHRGLVTPRLAVQGVADNTARAIEAAVVAGAHYVETDCRLTADGEVVLMHDDDLLRVAGDPRRVSEVTRRELGAVMADRGGMATLAEALAAHPRTRFNIDVKDARAAEQVGRLIAHHAERVLLTGFSDATRRRALRAVATVPGGAAPATSPGRSSLIKVLLAIRSGSQAFAASAFAGLDALQIPERQGPVRVLDERLLAAAHEHGAEVHVWTVNDPQRMRELATLGVDGLITDCADLALAAFA